METAQWPQEIGLVRTTEESGPATGGSSRSSKAPAMSGGERRIGGRPQKEQTVLNCPRCNSNNTKFCYYNNYSLSQPRYFCKTCRRYWTEGGSLRNVPVGGGSRKNKRSSSTRPGFPSSSMQSEGQDLNLGFQHPAALPPELDELTFSNMELLSGGVCGRPNFIAGDFVPVPAQHVIYPVIQDLRGFQVDGGEGGEASGDAQNRGQGGEQGFWNGVMGGGGTW